MTFMPIPAFNDNYIWMLINLDTRHAIVVDPGDATPVITALNKANTTLSTILITHHHWDHTGGVDSLVSQYHPVVYGPADCPGVTHPIVDGDHIDLPEFDLSLAVLATPGHTRDHLCYFGNELLFCGDTLFAAGCGRLFEGTPQQMLNSLHRLKALPGETRVYCAHEYTAQNLKFAETVEPKNTAIKTRILDVAQRCRTHTPTLPSSIALEWLTNPFLRCDQPTVKAAVAHHTQQPMTREVDVFAELRAWKDQFK